MADFLRTDDVAEADRFAQWRHWISSTFVPLECAQVSREPFRGEVASWELGEMLVSRVGADPHLASRTRRMIAMRDTPLLQGRPAHQGLLPATQEGREALLRPGDLAIYDCRRPYTMAFAEAHQMSFLMFPCDRLRLPPAAVDQVLVSPVSSAESTGSLVAPFLRQLVANLEQSKSPVNCRLADNLLDLLATMFGERAAQRPPTPPPCGARCCSACTGGSTPTWATPTRPGRHRQREPHLRPVPAQAVPRGGHVGRPLGAGTQAGQLPPRPGGPGAGPARGAGDRPALGLRGRGSLHPDLQGQLREPPGQYRRGELARPRHQPAWACPGDAAQAPVTDRAGAGPPSRYLRHAQGRALWRNCRALCDKPLAAICADAASTHRRTGGYRRESHR